MAPSDESPPRLEARGIVQTFPGVRALDGVDLVAGPGEVVAVLGENGAGKSTLMKVLAGVLRPDEGEVRVDGHPVALGSVVTALAAGVALIHQELNLADNLSVAANVMLGREPTRRGLVDERALAAAARPALAAVGLDVDPRTPVAELSIGRQQLVEIAKALAVDARVLIMDEPTSSLSGPETERLFEVVRDLRARGVTVLYISHRLGEVRALADRVVVLRDGANVGELAREEIGHDAMVRLMVGRDVSALHQRAACTVGEVVLEVEGLRTACNPSHPVDLLVRAGELVGIAGLVGAGRTEVLEAIAGVGPRIAGDVRVLGRRVPPGDPRGALDAGVALVPEDRKAQGLVLEMTVAENLSLGSLASCRSAGLRGRVGWIDGERERELAEGQVRDLGVRTPSIDQVVRLLSGGNQQKVVLGRWLARGPRVLLLDEPTRGVDVGAKQEIYVLLERLAAQGLAVLFVSSEMEEVLGLADRVLVLHEGRVTGELSRDALSEEAVMGLATDAAGARA